MLRLGKFTDYATLILGELAKYHTQILSAASLAEALSLSAPTVSKILKILSDAKLVTGIRGAEGGYRLAKPAETIKLSDVILAMEGGLSMTACCDKQDKCILRAPCVMRDNWIKVNQMIHTLLSQFTIADMLSPISTSQHVSSLGALQ